MTTKYVIVSVISGNQFEEGFYADKNTTIGEAISSYHALSDYDKKI